MVFMLVMVHAVVSVIPNTRAHLTATNSQIISVIGDLGNGPEITRFSQYRLFLRAAYHSQWVHRAASGQDPPGLQPELQVIRNALAFRDYSDNRMRRQTDGEKKNRKHKKAG